MKKSIALLLTIFLTSLFHTVPAQAFSMGAGIDAEDTGYVVTGGQSGTWFDPSHSGEGYVLQVMSPTQALIYWFTYDTNGNQLWMIGVGTISGSKITFNQMQITQGGRFGPEFNPADVQRIDWGTLELNFADCNNATATYQGPAEFGSGVLNVTRLSTVWGNNCSGNSSNPAGTGVAYLAPGFSGSWFDVSHNGEGFTLEMLAENQALIYWFTYDTQGNQAWMYLLAEVEGASILVEQVFQPKGATFGRDFDPADVTLELWGEAVFSFGSCGESGLAGSMRYFPPPSYGIESTQLLSSLVRTAGPDCMFLTDTHNISGTMTVAENIFVDGDVNDPNVAETPNDLDSPSSQKLTAPARVAGFATAEPTGKSGDRFESQIDEWDIYELALRAGEGVSLVISDWDPENPQVADLDLYLFDVNDTSNAVATSLTTNEVESVNAPQDGNYLVAIQAFGGQSNYLLQSGQPAQASSTSIDVTANFVSGQVLTALTNTASLDNNNKKDPYRQRIQQTEDKLGLNRVEQGGDGVLLYQLDTTQVHRLVPHPLTVAGLGSITPEEWQVIRVSKSLASNPDYRWAGPNYIHSALAVPNDEAYKYQWHYPQVRLPEAWDITTGKKDVVVAVIDSGVWDHGDLVANVDYALGYDFVSDSISGGDGDGIDSDARDPGNPYPEKEPYKSHGTHVAGTVGAVSNNGQGVAGVMWDVSIMPLRVLGKKGTGSCFDIYEGFRWAGGLPNSSGKLPARQADVINASLGGSPACPGGQEVIDQLDSKNIIVIAAAGNAGNTNPEYPASLNHVVSVSATTIADKLASYSTYGVNIDIAAPGGDSEADLNSDGAPDGVVSTLLWIEVGSSTLEPNINVMDGTSMASPHVAGIAGLMKSVNADMGPDDFHTAFRSGEITVDLAQNGPTTRDDMFGWGRIDALKAVQWAAAAAGGQQPTAFMTGSASTLDYGSDQQTIDLIVGKSGSGNLAVSDVGWTQPWIAVSGVGLDASGFGTYRISIDRTGLTEGQYSAEFLIAADDGSRLTTSILMRVGQSAAGEAGYVYTLLLDQYTEQNVKMDQGPQVGNGFDIELKDMPPGTYFVMVSTDLDNDGFVCDEGELCEFYPNNSEVEGVVISDTNVALGSFRMGFPTPDLKSSSQASSAVVNSMSADKTASSAPVSQRRVTAKRPRN